MIDFEKIAQEDEDPVTPRSGTSGFFSVTTPNMFGSLIKPNLDFMNPSKLSQLRTALNPESLFCTSPVISHKSSFNNIFIEVKGKESNDEEPAQEGAKTPNFF